MPRWPRKRTGALRSAAGEMHQGSCFWGRHWSSPQDLIIRHRSSVRVTLMFVHATFSFPRGFVGLVRPSVQRTLGETFRRFASPGRGERPRVALGRAHQALQRLARRPLCALAGRQTFGSFDEMLKAAPEPALVDFYSNTCGPCVMMGRTLDQVAGRLKAIPCRVMKVDVDKYPSIADRFQIQALPTLILFRDGKELKRFLGYRDGTTLEQEVRESLAQTSPAA